MRPACRCCWSFLPQRAAGVISPPTGFLEILDEEQPVAGADLIVLSEHVDYWDRLGWKDPFSSSLYTARQQDYTNRYNLDGVYTPQLVVDGRFGLVGSDGREASSAIQKAIRERKIPIEISNVCSRRQPGLRRTSSSTPTRASKARELSCTSRSPTTGRNPTWPAEKTPGALWRTSL